MMLLHHIFETIYFKESETSARLFSLQAFFHAHESHTLSFRFYENDFCSPEFPRERRTFYHERRNGFLTRWARVISVHLFETPNKYLPLERVEASNRSVLVSNLRVLVYILPLVVCIRQVVMCSFRCGFVFFQSHVAFSQCSVAFSQSSFAFVQCPFAFLESWVAFIQSPLVYEQSSFAWVTKHNLRSEAPDRVSIIIRNCFVIMTTGKTEKKNWNIKGTR